MESKVKIDKNISNIKNKLKKIQDTMAQLKKDLYGKFGTHINLEVYKH